MTATATSTDGQRTEVDPATGVSVEAWTSLGAQRNGQAWRIPERDAEGRITGWLVRYDDGRKVADKGSTRGLTMAWPLARYAGATATEPIVIVEGASDAAAGTDLGFDTVGRPAAAAGSKLLRQLVPDLHVVIVGENDASGVGRSGAEKLAADLHEVVASMKLINPPGCAKDLRDWYTAPAGCSREDLLAAIRAAEVYRPREVFSLTELGNAERLVDQHRATLLYCDPWSRWLVSDGKRWKADEDRRIEALAAETVRSIYAEAAKALVTKHRQALGALTRRSETRHAMAAMIDLARHKLPVTPDQLDLDPWLLNVANGTLDLHTGELRPHRREDLITKMAPVEYDAVAECLLWLKVLKRIMAGNESLIGYLQRMLGMCLTGDVSVQELFIFWGVGANGKNTLLDTIIGLMGDYACIAPPNLLTAKGRDEHPTEVADLFGKRLVVASETDEGRRLRTSMVKQTTGDLYLKGRYMRQDFFRFRRTHKTVLVTNNKPVVRESTKAMWRRIRLIPFNVVIPEAEWILGLVDELRAEWPGILRWLVQGCLSWQRDGLGTPEAVSAATAEYRSEQDQFQQFVDESCQTGADLFVTRGDVWKAFQDWAQRVGENRPLGRNHIYEQLRAAGYAEAHKTVAGKRTRVFSGVGLLHNDGAHNCTGRNSDSPFTPYEADL